MESVELMVCAQLTEVSFLLKGVAVRKASSTTTKYSLSNTKYSTRTPLASRNGRPRKSTSVGKKKSEDLSWFDSDSVFGLGVDD